MYSYTILVFLLSISIFSLCAVSKKNGTESLQTLDSKLFLQRYGYLPKTADSSSSLLSSIESQERFKEALVEFQTFYKLPTTGSLDGETLKKMQTPRCGLPDAFTLVRPWSKNILTWNFYHASDVENRIATRAFSIWQNQVRNLRFVHRLTSISTDIVISYQDKHHSYRSNTAQNCSFSDDTVLAHADYPNSGRISSEIHIDNNLDWNLNETVGVYTDGRPRLLDVLIHEIGHILGLSHSDDENSAMYAFYDNYRDYSVLSADDISGIQKLYSGGPAKQDASTPATPQKPPPTTTPSTKNRKLLTLGDVPDLCTIENLQHFIIFNNRMYVFYKKLMWSIDLKEKVYEPPVLIRNWFPFLPEDFEELDAVYQEPSGYIIAIIKSEVYIINPLTLQKSGNSPFNTNYFIPANSKLNAIVNTYTGRTFVFYDDIFIAELEFDVSGLYFHIKQRGERISNTDFATLPSGLDSAFRFTNGLLYFFKDDTVYEYDEFTKSLLRAIPISIDVFGINCPKESMLTQLKSLLIQLTNLVTRSLNETSTL